MARGSGEAKALEPGKSKDAAVKRVAKYTIGFIKKGESSSGSHKKLAES